MMLAELARAFGPLKDLAVKFSSHCESAAAEQLIQNLAADMTRIEQKIVADVELNALAAAMTPDVESDLDLLVKGASLAKRAGVYPYNLAKAIALFLLGSEIPEPVVSARLFATPEPELLYLIREQATAIADSGLRIEDDGRLSKIQQAYELGFEYEGVYRGCAQCVIAALFETTGNSYPVLFRAASSMGGGSALCGDGSCGGYNGAIMTIGSYVGRRLENFDGDSDEKTKSVALCQALHDRFIDTYGGVTCRDVHEEVFNRAFVLRKPEDKVAFEAAGAYKEKCNAVVGLASAWTMQLLFDNGYVK